MALGSVNSGGGGASLNFKVVGGTTQPENPTENTIWINTSEEITGWTFSASEPENPTEGLAWILIGTSSAHAFNALKKESIQILPLMTYQHDGAEFVEHESKIYQNGTWNTLLIWNGELYEAGRNWDHITGGWIPVKPEDGTVSSYKPFLPTITDNGETITAAMNNNYLGAGLMVTANDIDLSEFATLTAVISQYSSISDNMAIVYVVIFDRYSSGEIFSRFPAYTSFQRGNFSEKTFTLDVSSLSGSFSVGLYMCNGTGTRYQSATVHYMALS